MPPRASLRRRIRELRRSLTDDERAHAAQRLAVELQRHRGWDEARHIAAYWSADGEIDPAPALRQARATGKHTYLPLVPARPGKLTFKPWATDTPMQRNRFGIPEPAGSEPGVGALDMDLVLVPLVACDAEGHRLGMGGGFYDRTFAHRRRRGPQRPKLIGVGYAFQQVREALPVAPWDVPLDDVVLIATQAPHATGIEE